MFKELYLKWLEDNDIQLSRALDMHVLKMLSPAEQKCQSYIKDYRTKQARTWEQEPFKQRKHLVDAQRKLLTKETKSARSDERIATDKINTLTTKLNLLRNDKIASIDSRIFPKKYFVPIVTSDAGRPLIRTMRYLGRLPGKLLQLRQPFRRDL